MNIIKAAFSSSVSYNSVGLNSTLQFISLSKFGGGLNLTQFQLLD